MASALRNSTGADTLVFEVATRSSDTMRACLSIAGTLNAQTCALLTSAIDAHLRSGRRHLRVDMAAAEAVDEAAVDALRDSQRAVAGLGGLLTLDNAAAQLAGQLAEDSLVFASA